MSGAARPSSGRYLGHGLLALGVVLALLGSARLTPAAAGWQSRPALPLFGVGVTLMLGGLVLLRRRSGQGAVIGAEGATTVVLCQKLFASVRAIHSGVPGLTPAAFASSSSSGSLPPALDVLLNVEAPSEDAAYILWLKLQLDPVLDEIYPQVMASREVFQKQHGVKAFVALFSELAHAERLLNRAWSAAVDGYAEEARQSLSQSVLRLTQAEQMLG